MRDTTESGDHFQPMPYQNDEESGAGVQPSTGSAELLPPDARRDSSSTLLPALSQPPVTGALDEAAEDLALSPAPPSGPGATSAELAPPDAPPSIPASQPSSVSPTLVSRERRAMPGKPSADAYLRTRRADTSRYFRERAGGELVVDVPAPARGSGGRRALRRARDFLIGRPLTTAQQIHERLTKVKALAVLSSDAISSVAYATEASLGVLITAGLGVVGVNPWIAAAIAILMVIVGASYYQTIHAYPQGGGSYIVARANLGDWPGLVAAAALLIDYVLTVSVSISAGVDAIVSLDPGQISRLAVPLGVVFILIIMLVNLRGVRESGAVFAAPTYLFITCFLIMIGAGLVHAALAPGGLFTPVAPHIHPFGPPLGWAPEKLTVLLVLTAFASGCSAMTGVEAISNGVPAFQPPESRNAARTLIWMIATLVTLYIGVTFLAWRFGVEPYQTGEPTLTSQIAGLLFLGSRFTAWFYYLIQIATMLILVLAANTSYADFPRLASILAVDGWLPKGFSFRGNRLAFSTGIVALTILATVLMVAFNGNTGALINLYALGVFTAFTLSQSGMVVHWWRARGAAASGWLRSMVINGIGAVATGLVALVIMVAKFDRGAWIVVLLVPLLVVMFRAISGHYQGVRVLISELAVTPATRIRHVAIVPLARMDRVAERTLTYARSLGMWVTAVHIITGQERDEDIRAAFDGWVRRVEDAERLETGSDKPSAPTPALVIIRSPYRSLVTPLLEYIRVRHERDPQSVVTVFLPEYVTAHIWERVLHNETAFRLKLALYTMRDVVVTNVPYHLSEPEEPVREVRIRRAPPSGG